MLRELACDSDKYYLKLIYGWWTINGTRGWRRSLVSHSNICTAVSFATSTARPACCKLAIKLLFKYDCCELNIATFRFRLRCTLNLPKNKNTKSLQRCYVCLLWNPCGHNNKILGYTELWTSLTNTTASWFPATVLRGVSSKYGIQGQITKI